MCSATSFRPFPAFSFSNQNHRQRHDQMTSQKVQNMRKPKIVARTSEGLPVVLAGDFCVRILALEISSLCGVTRQTNGIKGHMAATHHLHGCDEELSSQTLQAFVQSHVHGNVRAGSSAHELAKTPHASGRNKQLSRNYHSPEEPVHLHQRGILGT